MQIHVQAICSRATGILILIGSLGCLKEAETMDMVLGKSKFQNSFPYFSSSICCRFTLELPHRQFQCVPTTYVFWINEEIHPKLF